jgi:putative Holliday junction resolvase
MKILGIDYGSKKIGLSISVNNLALPWQILKNFKNQSEAILAIVNIIKQENIEALVVGIPITLAGKLSEQTKEVKKFVAVLKENIAIPIFTTDERFSSQMAQVQTAGKNDDAQASANILQTYLDSKIN